MAAGKLINIEVAVLLVLYRFHRLHADRGDIELPPNVADIRRRVERDTGGLVKIASGSISGSLVATPKGAMARLVTRGLVREIEDGARPRYLLTDAGVEKAENLWTALDALLYLPGEESGWRLRAASLLEDHLDLHPPDRQLELLAMVEEAVRDAKNRMAVVGQSGRGRLGLIRSEE
jgi:DNA-binding PadR family transcriptional regulator